MNHFWLNAKKSGIALRWLADRLGFDRAWDNACTYVAVENGIRAVVAFHDWQPERGTIELTMFSDTPKAWTRDAIAEAFSYPFDRAGCQMVRLSVAPGNKRMRAIAARLGFSETVIPRGRGRDQDDIYCTLTDDVWRAGKFARRHVNTESPRAA